MRRRGHGWVGILHVLCGLLLRRLFLTTDAGPCNRGLGNNPLRHFGARDARSILPSNRRPLSNSKLRSKFLGTDLFDVFAEIHGYVEITRFV